MRALALLVLLPAVAHAQFGGYEQLARTTALTAADDYRIGKGYLDMMAWMMGEVDDPARVGQVEAVARAVLRASDRPDMVMNIKIIDDPSVNAAALPGGFLMVHRGLLDTLPPEDVAFVLAHEIAHVQLRHFATSMNVNQAMDVLAKAEASRAAEDKAGASASTEELSRMATRYARNLELEADLFGLLFAVRAGYPAGSALDAMIKMREAVGEVPDFLAEDATHPTFSQRIAELEQGTVTIREAHARFEAGVGFARAGQYGPAAAAFEEYLSLFPKSAAGWSNLGVCHLKKALQGGDDPWHDDLPIYVQADVQVRALDAVSAERARDALSRAIAIDPNRDGALAALASLARHEGDLKGARALLDKAMQLDAEYPGYVNNLGVLLAAAGDAKGAEAQLRKAMKQAPSAPEPRANLGRLLADKGKKKDAIALWEPLLQRPLWAQEAHRALVALGARDAADVPPPPKQETDELATLLAALGAAQDEAPADAMPEAGGAQGADRQVGGVALGDRLAQFQAALGEPELLTREDDGYYVYAGWETRGISVVFIDDAASSLEVVRPFDGKTARGVALGATQDAVRAAYGEPDYTYGGADDGTEAWGYEGIGHAFYFGDAGVEAFSVWTY